jgi:hypothetical protein
MAWGCHGSNSSSLPIAQHSAEATTMASAPSRSPPRRRATSAMPITDSALMSVAPMASPAPSGNRVAGTARRSKYTGPGLFTWMPEASECEVPVPSSGRCSLNTSRARMAKKALSPMGRQPRSTARTSATTSGISPTTTEAAKSRVERVEDRVRPSARPAGVEVVGAVAVVTVSGRARGGGTRCWRRGGPRA